jgi:putative Holliday junction resolvase
MRLIGLDVGEARIGVAVSDPAGILAFARKVLSRRPETQALEAIAQLVEEEEAQAIIVGLPRSLSGGLHGQAALVQAFAELLRKHVPVPIHLWDERLSTVAAEREMRSAGAKRERRKTMIDAVAAAIILQSYLDAQRLQAGGLALDETEAATEE